MSVRLWINIGTCSHQTKHHRCFVKFECVLKDQSLSIRATLAKLHSVDDAFRQQLETVKAAHQAELLQLAKEKQKRIDEAKRQVSSLRQTFLCQDSI